VSYISFSIRWPLPLHLGQVLIAVMVPVPLHTLHTSWYGFFRIVRNSINADLGTFLSTSVIFLLPLRLLRCIYFYFAASMRLVI